MRATSKLAVYFAIAVCLWCGPGRPSAAAQDQPTTDQKKANLIRSINAIPDLVAAGVLTEEQANNALTKLKVSLADLILASADPANPAAAVTSQQQPSKPAQPSSGPVAAPAKKASGPPQAADSSQAGTVKAPSQAAAPAAPVTTAPAPPAPPAAADAKCAGDGSKSQAVALDQIDSSQPITGSVKDGSKTTTVLICVNQQVATGSPVKANDQGRFSLEVSGLKNGDRVTARVVTGDTPGPLSDAMAVGKCSATTATIKNGGGKPTLETLKPGDQNVSGSLPGATQGNVRICVDDSEVATATVTSGGNFAQKLNAGLTAKQQVLAQQIGFSGTQPTYGKPGDPVTVAAAPTAQTPPWSSLFTRAVAGVQVSAGSSLTTQENLFLEFNVTAPMPLSNELKHGTERQAGGTCVDALNAQSQAFRLDPSQKVDSQGISKACEKYIPKPDPSGQTGNDEKTDLQTALYSSNGALNAATQSAFERSASEIRKVFDRDYSPISYRGWFWFNPRISAIPAQASSLLSNITTSSAGTNSLLTAAYDKAIQDIEMTGGIEFFLIGPHHHWAPLGGDAVNGLAFVAAGGFSTPVSATQNNAQIFSIPSTPSPALVTQLTSPPYNVTNICGTPGATTPCTSAIAFVPPSRTRFFLQEWGGLRWKSYYVKSKSTPGEYGGLCDTREAGQVCPIFPGTFDVTVGQNSAYTSGQVRSILIRTEAFFPLPFYPPLHLFFTGWVHASGKNQNLQPLLLDTASSLVTVTSPGVQTVVLPVTNRDFYRLGMGLDIMQLVGKLTKQGSAGSQTPASPASGTGTGAGAGGSKPAPAGASPTGGSGTGTPSTGSKSSGTSTTAPSAAAKVSQTGI